jgi:hypothetical protein
MEEEPMATGSLAELRDLLTAQELRLAAQETANTALRAQIATLLPGNLSNRRSHRTRHMLASALLALLIALVPLGLLAANPFTDLTGGPHDNDIDLIYNAGITKGCTATEYCPTEDVTREEMASFLARTAGLGNNPPVVNAKTLQGLAPRDFLNADSRVDFYYSFYDVVARPSSNDLSFIYNPGPAIRIDAAGTGERGVILPLDAPVEMFGRGLVVESATICYLTSNGGYIDQSALQSGTTGSPQNLVSDSTNRSADASTCYTIAPTTPQAANGALYLSLTLEYPQSDSIVVLNSVRLRFTPVLLP